MHFLLLFILSILSVSISAVPQGEDVSADQFDYSNSEVASNDPGGEDPLIPAGDTANWIDFSNPTDNIAGQNSLLPTAETANENDQMPNAFDSSSFFASNAAGQIKPPCKPNLASRDESDDLILADSGACAVRTDPNLLNNERLPPEPKPPKRDSPHEPKGSQQRFRTSDQDYIGSDKDKHSCESGYQYACCLFPLEALLGDVKHCVWYPHKNCDQPGWYKICCLRISRIFHSDGITYDDWGIKCLPLEQDEHGNLLWDSP